MLCPVFASALHILHTGPNHFLICSFHTMHRQSVFILAIASESVIVCCSKTSGKSSEGPAPAPSMPCCTTGGRRRSRSEVEAANRDVGTEVLVEPRAAGAALSPSLLLRPPSPARPPPPPRLWLWLWLWPCPLGLSASPEFLGAATEKQVPFACLCNFDFLLTSCSPTHLTSSLYTSSQYEGEHHFLREER